MSSRAQTLREAAQMLRQMRPAEVQHEQPAAMFRDAFTCVLRAHQLAVALDEIADTISRNATAEDET
jgi:hypothetical protein